MSKISDLDNQSSIITDDASVVIDRNNGSPLRITGSTLKSEISSRVKESVPYTFVDLIGDFKPMTTDGEVYSFAKAFVDFEYSDSTLTEVAKGIPILLKTNDVLSTVKGWLYVDNNETNFAKIVFEDGTSKTFEEYSDSECNVKLYSWSGIIANTEDWLSDIDIPGYPSMPTHLWNTSDSRNTVVYNSVYKVTDMVADEPLIQTTSSACPKSVELSTGYKVLQFSSSSSLTATSFDLDSLSKWTFSFWIKPSGNNETLLGSSTETNKIVLNSSLETIDFYDSLGNIERASIDIFDNTFHLLSLVRASSNSLKVYLDDSLISTLTSVNSLLNLDSFGNSSFQGLLGTIYYEQDVEAYKDEISHLYNKTKSNYIDYHLS